MATWDHVGYYAMYVGGGALVSWFVWARLQHDLAQRRLLKELIAGGFKIDHQVNSTITVVFDDTMREVAIIVGPHLFRYAYNQIDTWSHEFVDRNGSAIHNKLVITVFDPKHPRFEIGVSAKEARLWIAKMRAILAQ